MMSYSTSSKKGGGNGNEAVIHQIDDIPITIVETTIKKTLQTKLATKKLKLATCNLQLCKYKCRISHKKRKPMPEKHISPINSLNSLLREVSCAASQFSLIESLHVTL